MSTQHLSPEASPILAVQKTAAIASFKDWTNYLLVTTVAALGWVSTQPSDLLAKICSGCLALSIIAGIFTLAMVPLVTERLRDDPKSIYEVEGKFTLWPKGGCEYSMRLKPFCWPQHVVLLVGIVLYAARFILKADGIALCDG